MERYSRQYILPEIGREGQKQLLDSTVAVVGCGALGTVISNNLARAGVGRLILIDRDFVEQSNLQRQIIFTEDDVANRIPKAAAAKSYLSRVNSEIQIDEVIDDLNHNNIHEILQDVDLIIDGSDNFEIRFLLNDFAHDQQVPWIYGAAIGASGMIMPIIPGQTPCLRCFVEDLPVPGTQPTCETAGVIAPATGIIANLETAEAYKILLDDEKNLNKALINIDLWYNHFNNLDISKRNGCPTCDKGEFEFLQGKGSSDVTTMCGQDAVQILPKETIRLDLDRMKSSLEQLGEVQVTLTPFNLTFTTEGKELVLFKNGRAMVKNVSSEAEARSFYTRYIGS